MAVYRVLHKQHYRATIVEEQAQDSRGNVYILRNQGKPVTFAVGALIDDLTPAELEAFPDRFELVDEPVPASRAASSKASA